MKKRKKLLPQYNGELTARQAATAMQAARLNALDLLDTADVLENLRRRHHAMAFAILAIEEAAKVPILLRLFLSFGDRKDLWSNYRDHLAKTESLNVGIYARIRAEHPGIPPEEAKKLAEIGPTPEQLEIDKQVALYSDCVVDDEGFACNCPRNADWRNRAHERLSEARALVHSIRDRTPEELEVWSRHAKQAHDEGRDLPSIMEGVHSELVQKGFIPANSWDTLLGDLRELARDYKVPPEADSKTDQG